MEEKQSVNPAIAIAAIAIAIILIAVIGWKFMSPTRVGADGSDLTKPGVQPGTMPGGYGQKHGR